MSYIQPHMTEALAGHVLEQRGDHHYVIRRPGTGCYFLNIADVGGRIVLTGDLTIGGPHGCVSAGGYGIDWFSGAKSEGYLCSKFLAKEWQWEAAAETLHDWLGNGTIEEPEHVERIKAILNWEKSIDFVWKYDAPEPIELYEELAELGEGYVDDGVPGYDYPRAAAGWLCAVNQKFAELMAAAASPTVKTA